MRWMQAVLFSALLAVVLSSCRQECVGCEALKEAERVTFQLCLSEAPISAGDERVCAEVALVFVVEGE
jgi:hypothetical protein